MQVVHSESLSLNLYRLYGRSAASKRCVEALPLARGQNRSVLGVFGLSGMVAVFQKTGAIKRVDFERFLREHLLPTAPAGSIFVLDNARFHHGGSVVALVVAAGCSLSYLPPYSPNLSPLELAWSWSKDKGRLRKPRDDEQRS